jgi:hypothetical protein
MLAGGCMCGATRFRAEGDPVWQMTCHCRDCQRAAGADYVSWIGMLRAGVTWSGPRRTFHSSSGVTRSFCTDCGTPLSYETEDLPGETHLYAPTLDDPSVYRPTAQLYFAERVAWLEELRELPRHEQGSGSEKV